MKQDKLYQIIMSINYVELLKNNQSNKLCLEAVNHNGSLLLNIQKPTEEMILIALKQNGLLLKYVEHQNKEMCMTAVKENGHALQYVINQIDEICLEAIKKDSQALQYVKDQTNEMCIMAVRQDGMVLQYVVNQTNEICIKAIEQNRYALRYVRQPAFQHHKIFLEAVKQNYYEYKKRHIENEFVAEQNELIVENEYWRNLFIMFAIAFFVHVLLHFALKLY